MKIDDPKPGDDAAVRRRLAAALWLRPEELEGRRWAFGREERRDIAAVCLWEVGATVDLAARILARPEAIVAETIARSLREGDDADRELRRALINRWWRITRAEDAAFACGSGGLRLIPQDWTRRPGSAPVPSPAREAGPPVGPSDGLG